MLRRTTLVAVSMLLGCSSAAPPSSSSPPAASADDPAASAARPAAERTAITTESFGPLPTGAPLTQADLERALPGFTLVPTQATGQAGWLIKGPDGRTIGAADPEKIAIAGGPFEVHGVQVGDDGSRLAGTPFDEAYCSPEGRQAPRVYCNLDAVTLALIDCHREGQDEIPLAELAGCRVQEIFWYAVVPDEG